MPQVHSTSIVGPRVDLADDVVIGPWCVLEGRIRVGPGTRLVHRVSLQGPLQLGAGNVFYPGAAVGFAPQDRKFDPDHEGAGIVIGDRNIFREGFTAHRATGDTPTTLGSAGYYMANSHVAHDCAVGDEVMFANGAVIGGHVHLGDGVILGGNSGIHQFCRIGRMTMIAGTTGSTRDVPPFCVVYHTTCRVGSLNLVGLRRAGLRDHVRPLTRAFNLYFRRGLSSDRALDQIDQAVGDDPLVAEFSAFIRQARRGILPYAPQPAAGGRAAD